MGRPSALAIALPLWMCFGRAAASLHEPEVCYILDGILFLYGLMLTTLYCRLKLTSNRNAQAGKQKKIVEHNEGSASPPPVPTQQWSGVCATRDDSGVKQRRRQEGSRLGEPLKNPSTQA